MSIYLIDKIKPKNNGNFPMVDAADVEMPDGTRLSEFKGGASITVDSELSATSENPVQNKAVAQKFASLENDISESIEGVVDQIPDIDTSLSKAGQAADAGAVGAAIQQAALAMDQIAGSIPTETTVYAWIDDYLSEALGGDY